MLKRALFFSTPYCLSLRNGQMIIHTREAPDTRKSIPIEDIGFVVLEDQQTSITLPLLNALSDNNVAVIFCGENRMPNAMLSNLDSNRTQGENYRAQIEASEPLKKGLWKQIVEAKIRNQAALLRKLGRDGDKLKPCYMNVKSADADNREDAGGVDGGRLGDRFGMRNVRGRKTSSYFFLEQGCRFRVGNRYRTGIPEGGRV